MKKYDVFLFDADNTLFDYDMSEAYALKAVFDSYGFVYTESIRSKYREINSALWESLDKGKITKDTLQILRFTHLFEYIGAECDERQFNDEYLSELGKGAFLIDGAFEICKHIVSCNKSLYIVTNGILATQQSRIKHSPIKDYISDFSCPNI